MMNRLPTWIVVALALALLSSASLSAQTSKMPLAADHPAAGSTINAFLVCHPTSGTLPLDIQVIATTYNVTATPRQCFGRVDLETAGGLYLTAISSGEFTVPEGAGEYYSVSWIKPLPARILNVGLNRYTLTVSDITPPPYNQPPYPPSGAVDTGNCQVTGTIP